MFYIWHTIAIAALCGCGYIIGYQIAVRKYKKILEEQDDIYYRDIEVQARKREGTAG